MQWAGKPPKEFLSLVQIDAHLWKCLVELMHFDAHIISRTLICKTMACPIGGPVSRPTGPRGPLPGQQSQPAQANGLQFSQPGVFSGPARGPPSGGTPSQFQKPTPGGPQGFAPARPQNFGPPTQQRGKLPMQDWLGGVVLQEEICHASSTETNQLFQPESQSFTLCPIVFVGFTEASKTSLCRLSAANFQQPAWTSTSALQPIHEAGSRAARSSSWGSSPRANGASRRTPGALIRGIWTPHVQHTWDLTRPPSSIWSEATKFWICKLHRWEPLTLQIALKRLPHLPNDLEDHEVSFQIN